MNDRYKLFESISRHGVRHGFAKDIITVFPVHPSLRPCVISSEKKHGNEAVELRGICCEVSFRGVPEFRPAGKSGRNFLILLKSGSGRISKKLAGSLPDFSILFNKKE